MWANRSAANKSDRLITVSHDAKNGIVNDLNISHNKVDVTYLAAGIECSNKCVNHQSPPFIFLHIGGSAKNKNLCRTIEAMRVIVEMGRQVELHVIGTVDRYSNESWIHYHGSIDDAKLANMYSKAFALLFLSTYEGFGIPILEAMSFGVVVVTTRMTSMPEIAKDCAIYVDPNDTADIVNGVCDLMDNTHIAEDLVKRSLIHTSTFSWQKCAHQTLETYYSAIKS
jgi:glycosyltransferase involved in cell wall biosynthesis